MDESMSKELGRVLGRTLRTPDGCLVSTASTPNILRGGKSFARRRVVYMGTSGRELPAEVRVMMVCGNARCLEFEHMREEYPARLDPALLARMTPTCPAGHVRTVENTHIADTDRVVCRDCAYARSRAYRARGRAGQTVEEPTACGRGHEFTDENTIISRTTGQRSCKACRRWVRAQNNAGMCSEGHKLEGDNLGLSKAGRRVCRRCLGWL